jgi:hypothetical protein
MARQKNLSLDSFFIRKFKELSIKRWAICAMEKIDTRVFNIFHEAFREKFYRLTNNSDYYRETIIDNKTTKPQYE